MSGESLILKYYAEHALNTGGTSYETIPHGDIDLLVDLVVAALIENEAANQTATPDYSEGGGSVKVSSIAWNVGMTSAKLKRRLIDKYGGPVALVG
jgi:hypothetical protein